MKIDAIIDKSRLAKTDEEYLALHADNTNIDWLVRSAEDVQALRDAKVGPLGKLSEENYSAFFNSLQFSKGGLATMNYKPLMAELEFKDVNEMLKSIWDGWVLCRRSRWL